MCVSRCNGGSPQFREGSARALPTRKGDVIATRVGRRSPRRLSQGFANANKVSAWECRGRGSA